MEYGLMSIDYYDAVYNFWQHTSGMGLSSADSKSNMDKFLKRNPHSCFITLDKNKIVGSILAGHDGRRGYIHHMAVATEYRMQGIGKKLLSLAINALKKEGIQKTHLFIYKENSSGKAFWSALNWKLRDDLDLMSLEHA